MDQYSTFNDLPIEFLASMVYRNGKFLKAVIWLDQTVCLYALHNQFIEVWYDSNDNEINNITLATSDALEKFLFDISLPKIL
jgi:hypothetical protein